MSQCIIIVLLTAADRQWSFWLWWVELSALAILTPVAGRVPVSRSAHSVLRISLAALLVLSRDVALDCFTTGRAERAKIGPEMGMRPRVVISWSTSGWPAASFYRDVWGQVSTSANSYRDVRGRLSGIDWWLAQPLHAATAAVCRPSLSDWFNGTTSYYTFDWVQSSNTRNTHVPDQCSLLLCLKKGFLLFLLPG